MEKRNISTNRPHTSPVSQAPLPLTDGTRSSACPTRCTLHTRGRTLGSLLPGTVVRSAPSGQLALACTMTRRTAVPSTSATTQVQRAHARLVFLFLHAMQSGDCSAVTHRAHRSACVLVRAMCVPRTCVAMTLSLRRAAGCDAPMCRSSLRSAGRLRLLLLFTIRSAVRHHTRRCHLLTVRAT